jgi:hypothetical protein
MLTPQSLSTGRSLRLRRWIYRPRNRSGEPSNDPPKENQENGVGFVIAGFKENKGQDKGPYHRASDAICHVRIK